jgi:hypothetical protein
LVALNQSLLVEPFQVRVVCAVPVLANNRQVKQPANPRVKRLDIILVPCPESAGRSCGESSLPDAAPARRHPGPNLH